MDWKLTVFHIFQRMFGLWISCRTTQHLLSHYLLSKKRAQQILIASFLIPVLFDFLIGNFWGTFLGATAVPFGIKLYFTLKRMVTEASSDKAFAALLDRTILFVRSGKSLRNALELANRSTPQPSQKNFKLAMDLMFLDQKPRVPSSKRVENSFNELHAALRQSHKLVGRLLTLRTQIRIENDIRRKSSQALYQARLQGVILTFLFLGLSTFTIQVHGTAALTWLFGTAIWFAVGVFWIFQIGRAMKWKL